MARGDRSDALQKQFQKSVRKARSRGIDSRPRNINQKVKDQTKGIKTILQGDGDSFDGGRGRYIAAQSGINNLSNLLKEQQEKTLRDSIKSSFAKGKVNKSDFLGHAGDKMILGMNWGSTPTVAASTINPFSGKTIQTMKAREGLTGNQYSDYINDLYDLNTDLGYETFVPAPIKFLNKAMEVAAPFPLKILAGAMEGGKDAFDFFSDKGSRVGTDISDQLKRYYEGIRGLNPFEKTPAVEDTQGIKSIIEDGPTGDYFDTRKGFGTRMPGVPIIGDGAFNTRNQLDPNNQFDVAELTQEQIDFMRRPEQSLDYQSPDALFNKIKQLEDKGFLGFGAQEPTTREEFDQFIESGGIAQVADGGMIGGIASLDPRYTMRSNASNFNV